jgi:hypothetical protein
MSKELDIADVYSPCRAADIAQIWSSTLTIKGEKQIRCSFFKGTRAVVF